MDYKNEFSSETHLSNDNNNREDWHSLCARMELNTKQLSEPFFGHVALALASFFLVINLDPEVCSFCYSSQSRAHCSEVVGKPNYDQSGEKYLSSIGDLDMQVISASVQQLVMFCLY